MIKISFNKGKIIISIILCFLPVAIAFYAWFYGDLIFKLAATIWVLVAASVFYLRLQQLKRYQKGEAALTIDHDTLLNNSVLKPRQIPWKDIDNFATGLYRTDSIFIKLKDSSSLKEEKTNRLIHLLSFIDHNFSTKPAPLWIDMDVINIREQELISLLNQKLKQ
ncbi:STM3941 family protein [Sphingobacterium sp.]|uniref:STM3941 family protein n=1 Tax=Sphingobacterium sp. TaxID=341027 RepID=UPI0028A8A1F3|nr:STM3941 family protein [Sphingobacterium sp.]